MQQTAWPAPRFPTHGSTLSFATWTSTTRMTRSSSWISLDSARKTTLLHAEARPRYTQPTLHPHSEELVINNTHLETADDRETDREILKEHFDAGDAADRTRTHEKEDEHNVRLAEPIMVNIVKGLYKFETKNTVMASTSNYVFVTTTTSTSNINPQTTLRQLKTTDENRTRSPTTQHYLTYACKHLRDDRTLTQYDIGNCATHQQTTRAQVEDSTINQPRRAATQVPPKTTRCHNNDVPRL